MQKSMFGKGVVIGVIAIFILVGIQPAFAIEITNTKTSSENIEDCNCQVDNDFDIVRVKSLLNRAERSLNRVEIFTRFIPILIKDNPEVLEDCEELSEKITTFREMNEELKTAISGRDYPIICTILGNILLLLGMIGDDVWDLIDKYENTNPLFATFIFWFILVPVAFLEGLVDDIGYYLDCDWQP